SSDLVSCHGFAWIVAIAARPDTAGDDHGGLRRFKLLAHFLEQLDRLAIGSFQILEGIAELRGPIRIGSPGCAFKDEAEPPLLRYFCMASVVGTQPFPPLGGLQ